MDRERIAANEPVSPPIIPTPIRFIGCDVGKRDIVVFDTHDASLRTLANTPEALAAFAASLDLRCLVACGSVDLNVRVFSA